MIFTDLPAGAAVFVDANSCVITSRAIPSDADFDLVPGLTRYDLL